MTSRKKKPSAAAHPFEGYLGSDENILWMDGHLPSSAMTNNGNVAIIGLIICMFLISLMSGIYPLAVLLSCLFLAALVILFGSFWTAQKPQTSPKGVYALTNKHLFYRAGENVTELALQDVPRIDLMPGTGSTGTLVFGSDFPSLHDIEDAAYVKTMIEQAQLHRLEEEENVGKREE